MCLHVLINMDSLHQEIDTNEYEIQKYISVVKNFKRDN